MSESLVGTPSTSDELFRAHCDWRDLWLNYAVPSSPAPSRPSKTYCCGPYKATLYDHSNELLLWSGVHAEPIRAYDTSKKPPRLAYVVSAPKMMDLHSLFEHYSQLSWQIDVYKLIIDDMAENNYKYDAYTAQLEKLRAQVKDHEIKRWF